MDNSHPRTPTRLAQLTTGVRGLDRILRGGIPLGSVVLIAGSPGTGKTTLGNQIAHIHAAAGGTAIFTTAMAETHDRMLAHLASFSFFNSEFVGRSVQYMSILDAVRTGIVETVEALRRVTREHGATLLIVDGTAIMADLAMSPFDFRLLTNLLQAQSALLGCTTILLINRNPDDIADAATAADGLIDLRQELIGSRRVRTLEVVKLRGSHHLGGRHEFVIGPNGIDVFPRLEAAVADSIVGSEPDGDRLGFGVPELDQMLGGGLLPGSSTLLMGTPGAGKTLTGLHLIAEGAKRGERGLLIGFHEQPQRLIRVAARIGLDIKPFVENGLIRILWNPPLEVSPDAWAWKMLDAVEEFRPTRLIVDALTDVERRIVGPERAPDFVAALTVALRDAEVTTVFNAELSTLIGPELRVPLLAVSVALDNMILLRYFEFGSRLQRLVSVLKMRETAFDSSIRRFVISDHGIVIGEPFAGASALLTGAPFATSYIEQIS